MRRVALVLLALASACSAIPPVRAVDTSGDGVSFEYRDDQQVEAMRQASLYCANLGRNAVLRGVTQESGDRNLAAFDCR